MMTTPPKESREERQDDSYSCGTSASTCTVKASNRSPRTPTSVLELQHIQNIIDRGPLGNNKPVADALTTFCDFVMHCSAVDCSIIFSVLKKMAIQLPSERTLPILFIEFMITRSLQDAEDAERSQAIVGAFRKLSLLIGDQFTYFVREVETCRQQAPYALNPQAAAVNPEATERRDTLHAHIQQNNPNQGGSTTDSTNLGFTGETATTASDVVLGPHIDLDTNPHGNNSQEPVDGETGDDEQLPAGMEDSSTNETSDVNGTDGPETGDDEQRTAGPEDSVSTNETSDVNAAETGIQVQEEKQEDSVDDQGAGTVDGAVTSITALLRNDEDEIRKMRGEEDSRGVNAPCCCVIL